MKLADLIRKGLPTELPARADTESKIRFRDMPGRLGKPPEKPAEPAPIFAQPVEDAESIYAEGYECLTEIFRKILELKPFGLNGLEGVVEKIVHNVVDGSLSKQKAEDFASTSLLKKVMLVPYPITDLAAHSMRVGTFAVKVAIGLSFSVDKLKEIGLISLLHDVGMLFVPKSIMEKEERLSPAEIEIIRRHPVRSYEILKTLDKPWNWIAPIVVQEHERRNGKGYPKSLKGKDIHEYAQIIGVVDTFEALVHPRPYRPSMLPFEAVKEIIRLRASEFSTGIIKAVVDHLSVFPLNSFVKLNTGEIGRVVSVNERVPFRPVIEIHYDQNRKELSKPKIVDLEKDYVLYITSVERSLEGGSDSSVSTSGAFGAR